MMYQIIDYGMFSNVGNSMVSDIVSKARCQSLDWYGVLDLLNKLARIPEFSEATDTVVREAVYTELYERNA